MKHQLVAHGNYFDTKKSHPGAMRGIAYALPISIAMWAVIVYGVSLIV
ncbi:hypothetical protein [Sphingomonas immobilis]|uniref:Uncharacterized protein n=1 Tax=Sphingomonas immobilis TaxID=3063997 RepID=A0ABT9A3J7_9SPHN|nr:hypothetical protein [Sphingomonas sp. CA1-15]MDO7844418.1 hypothetical protein [Sphingomonas sp. CA1-15]